VTRIICPGACGPCYLSNSVQVDVARSENEVQANTDLEFQRNNESSNFVKLGHQLNSTISYFVIENKNSKFHKK